MPSRYYTELLQKEERIQALIHQDSFRVKVRQLMLFFVFGADETRIERLKNKAESVLEAPDTCAFLQMDETELSGDPAVLSQKVDEIRRQRQDTLRGKVESLNTFLLCPVIFIGQDLSPGVEQSLQQISVYMQNRNYTPVWQPFIIGDLSDEGQYPGFYRAVELIKTFYKENRYGTVNRCCLLGQSDSDGFSIDFDSILQTVVMTAVVQNIRSENMQIGPVIASLVSDPNPGSDTAEHFFSSRNTAIVNPLKTLILQRMMSVFEYFSGETDPTASAALGSVDFKFVNEIIQKSLEKMPGRGGKVTLYPLYGYFDEQELASKLEEVKQKKYLIYLTGNEWEDRKAEARKEFLRSFFAGNGSLRELKKQISSREVEAVIRKNIEKAAAFAELDDIPQGSSLLEPFYGGAYSAVQEELAGIICDSYARLLKDLSSVLMSPSFLERIDRQLKEFEEYQKAFSERLQMLGVDEVVLPVGGRDETQDFKTIQDSWVRKEVLDHKDFFDEKNRAFDKLVFRAMNGEEIRFSEYLGICYDMVQERTLREEGYLDRLSEECRKDRQKAAGYRATLMETLKYPVSLIGGKRTGDRCCVIGDPDNQFYRTLLENGMTGIDYSGFDRIETVALSAPFSIDAVQGWMAVEEAGKRGIV